MSEAKFTKGEWVVTTCGSSVSVWSSNESITDAKCFNYPDETYSNEILANAHLIAAAPEMYNMLEEIMLSETLTGDDKFSELIRPILAKARGE